MKVIQITSDYLPDPLWGMGWHVAQLREILIAKGVRVSVATAFKSKGYHENIITTDLADDTELLSSGKYEIFNDFRKFVAWQERLADKVIQRNEHFDVAHVHNWMSWLTAKKLARTGVVNKVLVTFHFLQRQYEKMIENPIPSFHKEIIEIETEAMRSADGAVLLSDSQLRLVEAEYGKEFLNKTRVIPHSVNFDTKSYGEIQKLKDANTYIDIVYVGRIEKDKGIEEALKAYSKLGSGNHRFSVVGDGPILERLRAEFCDRNVVFWGYQSRKQIESILSTAHIFCMPSTSENLPLSVLEAMFFGVVPIFTRGETVPNIFTDQIHGFTVKLNRVSNIYSVDDDMLFKALALLANNAGLRKKMSKAAYTYAVSNYSKEAMTKKILGFYRDVLDKNSLGL